MKRFNYIIPLILAVTIFVVISEVSAQDVKPAETPTPGVQRPAPNQPNDVRANALGQLGLTPDQIQKIRLLNMQRKPLMDAAQKNMREATMRLDEAIYADEVNDQEVNDRVKDVQAAQAEVQRLRFMNEFAVRKVLTPEQLLRFREIRKRFAEQRERMNTIRRNGNMVDGGARPIGRPAGNDRPNPNFDTKKPEKH